MEVIVRRLLEAARLECGDPPAAKFVRSTKLLRRALALADDLSPASRRALRNQENNPRGYESTPAVELYADVLTRLVTFGPDPLIEGEGNFGVVCHGWPGDPTATPHFTSCRITPRGLQWFKDNPGPDPVVALP